MKLKLNIHEWDLFMIEDLKEKGVDMKAIESDDRNFVMFEVDASELDKIIEYAFSLHADMTIGGGNHSRKADVFINRPYYLKA